MKDKNRVISTAALLFSIVFTYILFRILQPNRFGSLESMLMVLKQSLIPAVGACGCFFAYIVGLFDMSMGANIILSGLVGCMLSIRFGYIGLFAGSMATGLMVGVVNALVTQKLRIPSVVATVGTLILYESFSYYITIVAGGTNSLTLDHSLRAFGAYPWNLLLCSICFAAVYVLYKYSKLGVYCNAIGTNRKIAEEYGIDVDKWVFIASAVGGLFIGIMGMMSISYGSTFTPALNMESFKRGFSSMMGSFIGVAMKKYMNPVIAIILGEFLMYLLMNGLITCGVDSSLQDFVQGVVLILVVCVTMKTSKYEEVA